MAGRVAGKVAIVTGGGSGMGRAIALTFARESASVVIADVNEATAREVANEVEALGQRAVAVMTDVSSRIAVYEMVARTLDAFNKIDILVNNAGIVKLFPAAEMTEAQWDATLNTNLKGPFLCSQAVGKQMIMQKSGKIVNIASTSGHRGVPLQAHYCSAKTGLIGLTRALAVEWAKYNINVNAVSPGTTDTPTFQMFLKQSGLASDFLAGLTALKRINQPQDIADAVLFLCSEEARNITGWDIAVEGGQLARVRQTET